MSGNLSQLYSAPLDFRIPSQAPTNVEPAVRVAIEEVYATLNLVVRALVNNCGIGPQLPMNWSNVAGNPRTLLSSNLRRFYARAAEPINTYSIVALFDAGTEIQMRLADATDNTRVAVGYCNTPGGLIVNQVGEFILGTGVPLFAGMTPGAHYWLSTTAGNISNAPAVAAGNVEQYLGVAFSATELNFSCSAFIQH